VNDVSDLRNKIDEARRRLPLPELMARIGLGDHARKEAHCPFHHPDAHPSFSVFQKTDGTWWHRCFVGCSEGDEISFLRKLKGLSLSKAMNLYLDMSGFPASRPSKSREYPKCPESPTYPVSPVSNGQGLEEELKGLAARNACTARDTARERRWKLGQDLKAVEKRIASQLSLSELLLTFDEWYRLSLPFLDPEKTREIYLVSFLAEFPKVRRATGDGDTLNKALGAVAKLSLSELPVIGGMPNAPESWRRVAALHREISHRCANKTYFLTCRDAAKACPGLSYQTAYNINVALSSPQLGVIKLVRVGEAREGGRASEFRYLLPITENGSAN
jgi:hypothetical protein